MQQALYLEEGEKAVSLMTLHSAKGLEFNIVFLVGFEQGLLPHNRSLRDEMELEEERRLCYVGITRAKEQLFITYARERYTWGNVDYCTPSQFLDELPAHLLSSNLTSRQTISKKAQSEVKTTSASKDVTWQEGDRVYHPIFGNGIVTNLLGLGKKNTLVVQFESSRKIINPTHTKLEKIS